MSNRSGFKRLDEKRLNPVFEEYIGKSGKYEWVENGWPDFILRDKETNELWFIEVKGGGKSKEKISAIQAKMFDFIERHLRKSVMIAVDGDPANLVYWRNWPARYEHPWKLTTSKEEQARLVAEYFEKGDQRDRSLPLESEI